MCKWRAALLIGTVTVALEFVGCDLFGGGGGGGEEEEALRPFRRV